MSDIILSTINSKYIHTSLGLRYLYANLGELQANCELIEFTLKDSEPFIVETILNKNPKIFALGVYIWNIEKVKQVVQILRKVNQEIKIILGGPEVSYGKNDFLNVDNLTILKGEADLSFANSCKQFLNNETLPDVIEATQPELLELSSPYPYITEEDISNKLIYVESSRGCVFKCEFCLSSIEEKVRKFDLNKFLDEMKVLLDRGCKCFKFVDRTFNLNIKDSKRILEFFLAHADEDVFLHFELVPDHFPESLKECISKFKEGQVQFEIGIQTFANNVLENISRKMNVEKTVENIRFLKNNTRVHLHTDLIVGLPGESIQSFEQSFNLLYSLTPEEIQVGILKNLKGTPIVRHYEDFEMIFEEKPPYAILQNALINFSQMQELKRFARYIDIFYNCNRFEESFELLIQYHNNNAFNAFMSFGNWIWEKEKQEHDIGLKLKFQFLYDYLTSVCKSNVEDTVEILARDFMSPKLNPNHSQSSLPDVLRKEVDALRRGIQKSKR